jgi:WD40 repeat protein
MWHEIARDYGSVENMLDESSMKRKHREHGGGSTSSDLFDNIFFSSLVNTSAAKAVRWHSVRTGDVLCDVNGTHKIHDVCIDVHCITLAIFRADQRPKKCAIDVWNLSTNSLLQTFPLERNNVMALSSTGNKLVVASGEKAVTTLDISTGMTIWQADNCLGDANMQNTVMYSFDDSCILVMVDLHDVVVLDAVDGSMKKVLIGRCGLYGAVVSQWNNATYCAVVSDYDIRLWDYGGDSNEYKEYTVQHYSGRHHTSQLCFGASETILLGSTDGTLAGWQFVTSELLFRVSLSVAFTCIAYNSSNNTLVAGSSGEKREISIFTATTGELLDTTRIRKYKLCGVHCPPPVVLL